MNTNAGLFCDARLRLHVIRNDVEKVVRTVVFVFSSFEFSIFPSLSFA